MPRDNDHQRSYLDDIPTGKTYGISRSNLSIIWSVDERTVSAIIADLRNRGEIIASGNTGYYRPATDDELAEYYRIQRRRALSILKTLKMTRRVLKSAGVPV